ncbi:MAG: hypothetical protein KGZ93_09355 [Actinobacteria bacterium]|nr:hypothetical protein [Actinomycetota bacterium]
MGNLTRNLYKAARISNDIEKLASGDPKRIGKRILNKKLGRFFGKFFLK